MREAVEIITDGRTTWVNAADGMCIGRIQGRHFDVHRTATEQMDTGQQCLACGVAPTAHEAWRFFSAEMLNHHGVSLPESPEFI